MEKDKLYLLLAGFYNEIGSYLLAFNALEKCVSLANSEYMISYELQNLETFLGQKKLRNAKESILKMQKKMVQLDSSNREVIAQKAMLQVLKAKYLLINGSFEEAKEHFNIQKKELEKQQNASSLLLELEAEMYLQRQQYELALSTYKKAYSTLLCFDYQVHKIYLLSKSLRCVCSMMTLFRTTNTSEGFKCMQTKTFTGSTIFIWL